MASDHRTEATDDDGGRLEERPDHVLGELVEGERDTGRAMSQENVEIVRRGYEYFRATGELRPEIVHPDFVWDMSMFRGWPEQHTYLGRDGAMQFLADWTESWEEWELQLEELRDAGDRVVAILRQRGRSKATGLPGEMHFAQVWTLRDGKQFRMEMYASPGEAFEAVGLRE
jgi:ketosteroid isomerase-like protein